MSRWTPVPVAGGAYADDCLPFASQDCVNYIPVMAEKAGARSPAMLRGLPGCTTFSVTGSNSPIRGTYNAEGRLLTVTGSSLYKIGADGAATSLGAIPGVGRVSIAHNQITDGNEIAIANGQSGYVYDTTTETLVQITDPGFPGAKVFGFVDGFLMYVEPRGRYFGWSDLAAGTSYNTLDTAEAEVQPDRIVSGIETAGDWMILGERTCEFYRNTGAATGTFQRIEGTALQVGCAGTFTVGKVDNSVIFVGHDGSIYRLMGYQAQRISTHAIEQQLRRCNLANAFVTVFEDDGHKVWYLTCPDGKTWGYDVATGEWHRRRSDGLDRWRMATLTRWNRRWIAGDYANGKLYELDWEVQSEAGAEMERLRTLPIAHDNGNRITINAVRFEFDTGDESVPTPLLAGVTISGDLPGGYVGESGTYQYTSAGGVLPHTFAITAGSLPPGATMDAAGLVTYAYTTAGSYGPWTVTVTDADGDTATLLDSAEVLLRSWLMGYGTNTVKPSPDGEDWTAAGASAAGAGATKAFARNGTQVLRVSVSSSTGTSFSANSGATWAGTSGLTLSAQGGSPCYSGGYWHVADTTYKAQRSADGINFAKVASAPTCLAIAPFGDKLVSIMPDGGTNLIVSHADLSGAAWANVATVPVGLSSVVVGDMVSAGGVLGLIMTGSFSRRAYIYASTDGGLTFPAVANPFPDDTGSGTVAPLLHHDATLGWVAVFYDRIAYGPTLETLSLSAHVLPERGVGIDSDGLKFIVCGANGMLQKSANGNVWTALTSGATSTIGDVVFAPRAS